MNKTLLPCPFCGGEVKLMAIAGEPYPPTYEVDIANITVESDDICYVHCPTCGANWHIELRIDAFPLKTIAAWNRRTGKGINVTTNCKGGDKVKCEKCGAGIDSVLVNMFNRDGSDCDVRLPLIECEEGAAYIDTTQNWTGYELTESEMQETIQCPQCKQFPFKNQEIQVYDLVRVVCFRQEATP